MHIYKKYVDIKNKLLIYNVVYQNNFDFKIIFYENVYNFPLKY